MAVNNKLVRQGVSTYNSNLKKKKVVSAKSFLPVGAAQQPADAFQWGYASATGASGVNTATTVASAGPSTPARLPSLPLLQTFNPLLRQQARCGGRAKVAAALSSLPLLQTLDLGHKQLGAEGGARVAAALPSLPLLQALKLGGNGLGAEVQSALKAAAPAGCYVSAS